MRALILSMLLAASGPALAQTAAPTVPVTTTEPPAALPPAAVPSAAGSTAAQADAAAANTYSQQDILTAADGAFGKGAAGLAKLVETIFKDRGQPNGYIVGREASGAFFAGPRYGSGTLFHKIEGQMPVFWTGPSLGFDIGGDGSKVFTLVYNLNDTADLFRRFPAAEGKAYFIGGFTANYNQRGSVVLVPVKLGVGWRLGVNAGWLNYTRTSRLLPF